MKDKLKTAGAVLMIFAGLTILIGSFLAMLPAIMQMWGLLFVPSLIGAGGIVLMGLGGVLLDS